MKVSRKSLVVIIFLWTIAVGVGTVWMTDNASRPGTAAISSGHLPIDDFGARDRAKLLIFLHPQCSCGRATIAELARITANDPGAMDIRVFFYQPSDQPLEWVQTDIWHQALADPDVVVSVIDDQQLKVFGAVTSGQAMLYDKNGNLVFSGGITPGRGHEGENQGRESIEKFLQTGKTDLPEAFVFGCSLSAAD